MSLVKFDDSRIKDHPDKRLLRYIRTYFKAFTTGDFEGIRDLETEDYTMTDIPLGVIRAPREVWYNINKTFVELLSDLSVVALTLYGSSKPGSFSILEHVVKFKLINDPPPGAAKHLPAGAKGGDTVGMVNIAVLWWTEDGKISRELEYGRLTWEDFDLEEFDRARKGRQAQRPGSRSML